MTTTISLLAPNATPGATFQAQSGTAYTADAYGVIKNVPPNDVLSLLAADCIPLGQAGAKSNLNATSAPTTSNDSTQDYGIGSRWIDVTNKSEYFCVDATATAAVWVLQPSPSIVNVTTATLTVTAEKHAGKTVTLNRAAGVAVTLPAATGSGNRYEFVLNTTVTSVGTTIKVANVSDSYQGNSQIVSDDTAAVKGFIAAASDDTVTLNGTTTGGYAGDRVLLIDVAANLFQVEVRGKATGTEATCFSATV